MLTNIEIVTTHWYFLDISSWLHYNCLPVDNSNIGCNANFDWPTTLVHFWMNDVSGMNSLRLKIVRLFKWNNRLQELWLFTKYGIIRNKRCFLGVHRCMNSPTHSQTLHEALRASFSLWVSWSRSYTWWTPKIQRLFL